MEASTGYVFEGKPRPDPLKGALPVRDRAFYPRPNRAREEIAFRVRFRFGTDPEGVYRVTQPMWEIDAVSLRDTYASTEAVDFDPRFPDGLEPIEGWSLRPSKAHNFKRPVVLPKAYTDAPRTLGAEWGQRMLGTVKAHPAGLIAQMAACRQWLETLSCSEADEALAGIEEYISLPLAHSGPLHHEALHG